MSLSFDSGNFFSLIEKHLICGKYLFSTIMAVLEMDRVGLRFLSLALGFPSPHWLHYSVNRHFGIDRAQQHGLADETCPL